MKSLFRIPVSSTPSSASVHHQGSVTSSSRKAKKPEKSMWKRRPSSRWVSKNFQHVTHLFKPAAPRVCSTVHMSSESSNIEEGQEEHALVVTNTARTCDTGCPHDHCEDDDDDLSSVSILSEDLAMMKRNFDLYMQRQELQKQKKKDGNCHDDVPLDIFVPSYLMAYALPQQESTLEHEQFPCLSTPSPSSPANNDPAPVQTVIRTDGPLDMNSLEGMISVPSEQLDQELRARLEATCQLSSMMGPTDQDVLLSLKYVGKLLSRQGDFVGAQVIQGYIQDARNHRYE